MIRIDVARAGESVAAMVSAAERGDEVVLERDGKAVARLIATVPQPDRRAALAAVREMDTVRRGNILGPGLTIRQLIDEGRG